MARPISCRTDAIAAHSLRKIGSLATVYGMAAVGATLSPKQVAAKVGYPPEAVARCPRPRRREMPLSRSSARDATWVTPGLRASRGTCPNQRRAPRVAKVRDTLLVSAFSGFREYCRHGSPDKIRQAAFDYVSRDVALQGGVPEACHLAKGFDSDGQGIPLINPQRGILNGAEMERGQSRPCLIVRTGFGPST
jgi:hypothetical protein